MADGSRGMFHYTDMPTVPLSAKISLENRVAIESKFQAATPGGHLYLISLSPDVSGAALLKCTEAAFESGSRFLAYTSNYSSCSACNYTSVGMTPKCSKCGSDRVTYLGRSSYGMLPFNLWPEAKRRGVEKRVAYSLSATS